jgi:phthalate 4,5-cis-dihydrodiol dehydrogenase
MIHLRIGVAGLGRAFSLMLPTLAADSRVQLVAAADLRPEARGKFASDFGGATYESVEALCADPAVEVVYVATPHQFHAEHARLAFAAGKHALVEKPMALTLDECRAAPWPTARARPIGSWWSGTATVLICQLSGQEQSSRAESMGA